MLAAVLSLFARRTTLGSLVRAASDSEAGIAILGYSLNAIATSTWVAGSMLAGLAGILIAPITSLSVDGIILLIIPALAVTLLAGFTSFWVATGAGLVLGIAPVGAGRVLDAQLPDHPGHAGSASRSWSSSA